MSRKNEVLGLLRLTRCELLEACNDKPDSRAQAMVLTKIDEAILWQEQDQRLKAPTINAELKK